MKQYIGSVLFLFALNACNSPDCELIPAESPTGQQVSIISGHVYDAVTGERVSHARVSVVGSNLESIADSNGVFHFNDLLAGDYTFDVQKDNVGVGTSQAITVASNDSLYAHISLMPVAGYWSVSIFWGSNPNPYPSSLYLFRDGTLEWNADGKIKGTWSLTGDSIAVDFANGTMLDGIVNDSLSGLVDQRDFDINGTFVAKR